MTARQATGKVVLCSQSSLGTLHSNGWKSFWLSECRSWAKGGQILERPVCATAPHRLEHVLAANTILCFKPKAAVSVSMDVPHGWRWKDNSKKVYAVIQNALQSLVLVLRASDNPCLLRASINRPRQVFFLWTVVQTLSPALRFWNIS